MKKIFLVLTMIMVSASIFAGAPSKSQVVAAVTRAENSQQSHSQSISDMEASLRETDEYIEYRNIQERLSNKGSAMSWQKHLFETSGRRADKEAALTEYKKLDGEYNELVKKLKEIETKYK
jgi:hypothetical protein